MTSCVERALRGEDRVARAGRCHAGAVRPVQVERDLVSGDRARDEPGQDGRVTERGETDAGGTLARHHDVSRDARTSTDDGEALRGAVRVRAGQVVLVVGARGELGTPAVFAGREVVRV